MKPAPSILAVIALLAALPMTGAAEEDIPPYLRDRGTGIRTSMFGTYVRRGELIVYPFYEYYRDNDLQYSPSELGGVGDQDFEGRYRANEGLVFIGMFVSAK